MINYRIERLHIEQLLLSCFLNQNKAHDMDRFEFESYKLPFELFKANKATKLISKAIYNFQLENKPIDEDLILCYIQKHTQINSNEWLDISCKLWVSFDTMITYLNMLKDIDKEENKMKVLEGLI